MATGIIQSITEPSGSFDGTTARAGVAVGLLLQVLVSTTSVNAGVPAITLPAPGTTHSAELLETEQQTKSRGALVEAIRRLTELEAYLPGWNGPDSVAPSITAISAAKEFAQHLLERRGIVSPHISASDDGEINFFWNHDGLVFDLGFSVSGRYSYYALSDGHEFMGNSKLPYEPLPAIVEEYLAKS